MCGPDGVVKLTSSTADLLPSDLRLVAGSCTSAKARWLLPGSIDRRRPPGWIERWLLNTLPSCAQAKM